MDFIPSDSPVTLTSNAEHFIFDFNDDDDHKMQFLTSSISTPSGKTRKSTSICKTAGKRVVRKSRKRTPIIIEDENYENVPPPPIDEELFKRNVTVKRGRKRKLSEQDTPKSEQSNSIIPHISKRVTRSSIKRDSLEFPLDIPNENALSEVCYTDTRKKRRYTRKKLISPAKSTLKNSGRDEHLEGDANSKGEATIKNEISLFVFSFKEAVGLEGVVENKIFNPEHANLEDAITIDDSTHILQDGSSADENAIVKIEVELGQTLDNNEVTTESSIILPPMQSPMLAQIIDTICELVSPDHVQLPPPPDYDNLDTFLLHSTGDHPVEGTLTVPDPIPLPSTEIIMDMTDPLDFELSEDVSESDLMQIIDQNMDYCSRIHNCNPISSFILMNQPNVAETGSGSDTCLDSKGNPIEKVFIPVHPILDPAEIEQILGANGLESQQKYFQCPRCPHEQFLNYEACKLHMDSTCENNPNLLVPINSFGMFD